MGCKTRHQDREKAEKVKRRRERGAVGDRGADDGAGEEGSRQPPHGNGVGSGEAANLDPPRQQAASDHLLGSCCRSCSRRGGGGWEVHGAATGAKSPRRLYGRDEALRERTGTQAGRRARNSCSRCPGFTNPKDGLLAELRE